MAPKQPSQTTQVTKVELPKWVDEASQNNYAIAEGLSQQPFQQYQGERVASTSPFFSDAMAKLTNSTSALEYGQASSIFSRLGNEASSLTPSRVSANNVLTGDVTSRDVSAGNAASNDVVSGLLKNADLSKYLNPQTAEVENRALDTLDRSRRMSLNQNSSAAQKASAFGGSRHAIIDAVTNSETNRAAGDLSANLRRDAFDKAMGWAGDDIAREYQSGVDNETRRLATQIGNIDRQFAAATGNETRRLATETDNMGRRLAADTANADRNLNAQQSNAQNILNTFLAKSGAMGTAGQGMLQSAAGMSDSRIKEFAGLMQGAAVDQQQRQQQINSDIEKFNEPRQNDIDNLNMRLSALGMSPYGKTEATQKTTSGGSSGTDWGQLGLGVFSLLLGLSDDNTKTDKEKVGKIPGTDLEAWAFRYKGDPKTYPKSVGVMASDVEKKMPSAVHRIGKRRVIDYGAIMEAASNGRA